jgi:hypothetical protein
MSVEFRERGSSSPAPLGRRDFLARSGMGLGGLALAGMIAEQGRATGAVAGGTHFAPRARRVIHFFCNGGPSHVDTFDPKPALAAHAGKPLPVSLTTERKTGGALPSEFAFARHGASGLEISELFAKTAAHADDIAVIRSMQAQVPNHEPSLMLMNCGNSAQPRPSVGAWVTYGLGSDNENLPAFVAMCPGGMPIKDSENWQAAFLPGTHQATFVDPRHTEVDRLVENIRSRHASPAVQRDQLDLLAALDAEHGRERTDPRLEARIRSFELAYRMQVEAADAFDIGREPERVRQRYGDHVHGRQTLIARRLLERGVRYVQLWHGAGQPWDTHSEVAKGHRKLAGEIDGPIAALMSDLKERGMFEDTLVIWGGEFGRTPVSEGGSGRDHNHYGFSVWLAGGGVRGGTVHGATDDFGFKAVEKPTSVHDLHATILHLLGLDHERLTYRYAGRDFRLTDVHGRVIREIVG